MGLRPTRFESHLRPSRFATDRRHDDPCFHHL
jgi:hypothetical protein